MTTSAFNTLLKPGKAFRIGLWVAQTLLALMFIFIGFTKMATPIAELAAMMKWPGEYSPIFVRLIGAIDMLGGLGLLLPSVTRILPRLSVLAALGCTVLQVLAIAFHVSRGEFMVLPLNAVLIALCIFVLWGRAIKLPITART